VHANPHSHFDNPIDLFFIASLSLCSTRRHV
jgi:hypothetical protein